MAAGLNPTAFWDLTPRLFMVHMSGARQRADIHARQILALAYNTAALMRAKNMPSPRDFIGGRDNKLRGRAALDQMRAYAARLPKRSWEEWQKLSSAR